MKSGIRTRSNRESRPEWFIIFRFSRVGERSSSRHPDHYDFSSARVHNDWMKKRRKKERGGEKKWTSARTFTFFRLNLRQRSDRRYFQLNTRNDPRGGSVASIQRGTLEERALRALWILYPRVHYTPDHSRGVHARIAGNNSYVCLWRGEGGSVGGVRGKNKRQVGTRATIPYLISGVARFAALLPPLLPSIYFTFASLNKRSVLTGLWVLRDCRRLSILVDRLSFGQTISSSPPFSQKKKKIYSAKQTSRILRTVTSECLKFEYY